MNYVCFDPDTGEIMRSGFEAVVPEEAGLVCIEGVGTWGTHWVCNGVVTPYTQEQRAAKASGRPSDSQAWDNQSMSWIDTRTLDSRKASRWAAIKSARGTYEFGGFTWDGSTFDSDEVSQARIMGAVQMAVLAKAANQPFSIAWTLADNTVRTLTGDDMIAVGLALGTHVGTAHAIGRSLRAAIEAASTAGQVEAVTWP